MITKTGKNLNIIISAKVGEDWLAFSTWYSISKNLPDANVFLVINRTTQVDTQNYMWVKRLKINHIFQNQKHEDEVSHFLQNINIVFPKNAKNVLIVNAFTMAIDMLDESLLECFNQHNFIWSEGAMFVNRDYENFLSEHGITQLGSDKLEKIAFCFQANSEKELKSIVNFFKGCGRWINTMKGCPSSIASSLITNRMTTNEMRIIELWQRMVSLINAVL